MNIDQWNILLNFIPVIGTVLGVLMLVVGFLLRNNVIVKQIALAIFIVSALSAIVVFVTGAAVNETVEKLPGVTENIIKQHTGIKKLFLSFVVILGIFSLVTFLTDRKKIMVAPGLYVVTLLLSVGTIVFAKQTVSTGSEIRNIEILKGERVQTEQTPSQNAKAFNEK